MPPWILVCWRGQRPRCLCGWNFFFRGFVGMLTLSRRLILPARLSRSRFFDWHNGLYDDTYCRRARLWPFPPEPQNRRDGGVRFRGWHNYRGFRHG